jgi:hypothetical protein
MDPEGSECIQKNNTFKVKTLGLIVVIVIPLTYISKSCYITNKCCSCDNIPYIVLILEMYSSFSFRRYSCIGYVCFLVPDMLNKKRRCLSFRGSHLTQKEPKPFEKEEE